jgi:hypothetical protein
MKETLIRDEAVVYGTSNLQEKGVLSQDLLQIQLVMRRKH